MRGIDRKILPAVIAAALAAGYGLPAAYAQQEEGDQSEQETTTQQEEDESTLERIVVTGSRIRSIDMVTTQPVQTIDSEYLAERGLVNAQDAVTDIPGVFAAATPILGSNEAASSQGVGQRTINLFGLGSQRTLALVDGKRFVSSNSPVGGASNPGSQLDVNNIPIGLIDRIEVMNVGGAAIYGADAVAGVVNYILKDDYEGLEFSADNRFIGEDIGEDTSFRGLLGGNFAQGRGNVVFSFEYNEMDNILAEDVPTFRDGWSSFTPLGDDRVLDENGEFFPGQSRLYPEPRAGILTFSGLATPIPIALTALGYGAWPDGNFYQFDPSGSGNLVQYDPGQPVDNAVWSSGGDGLNLEATNTAQEGYERWNFTTMGRYEINEYVNFKARVFNNNYKAENPGYQAALYNSGIWDGMSGALAFSTDHPLLPQSSREQLEQFLGGPGTFYVHRGWANLGQREVMNETNVFLTTVGFDGEFEFGDKPWHWEVDYQNGASSVFSQDTGFNDWRFLAAMDVGINPETGQPDCRFNYEDGYGDELRPSGSGLVSTEMPLGNPGDCAPLDPFGTISDEAFDYISYNDQGKTRIEQEIVSAYIGGDLFDLPAGTLGFATGVEYREEFASYDADGSANLLGFSDSSMEGQYNTTDIYAEFLAPIFSPDMGIPGLHSLSLEGSYRTMDNSRAGTDNAWAIGMNWRPIADVMVRANTQQTVRAPAVTEMFLPVVETQAFGNDPCDQRFRANGPDPATRDANCSAEGIPDDFTAESVNASRRGWTGGNVNLENEQADSVNVGIAYSPSQVPGLLLQVDFIDIEIEDAIVQFSLTDIMEACYDATNYPNRFCDMFERQDNFQLPPTNAFTSGYVNAAAREFRAMVYNIQYSTGVNDIPLLGRAFGDTNAGMISADLRVYNQKENAISNTGFDFSDSTGQYNSPDWRGDLRLRHSIGDLVTVLDIEHHGSGKRNVESSNPLQYIDQNGNPYTEMPSITRAHLALNYTLPTGTVLRARVTNLTEWEPSPKQSAVGYWTYGRSYNIGLTHRF